MQIQVDSFGQIAFNDDRAAPVQLPVCDVIELTEIITDAEYFAADAGLYAEELFLDEELV